MPVQLDFIGTTTLTSGNRLVATNDTLTTRAYAVGNDNALQRLRVSVTYEPGLLPFIYPTPVSSFNPAEDGPPAQTIIYLDSLINPLFNASNPAPRGGEYVFENRFSARSTVGTELWQYTATDETGQSAARAYRLTARRNDSAAVFQSYTLLLRPQLGSPVVANEMHDRARVFLNLHYGLLLPKYSVINREASVQANQQLVDVICVTNGATISLRGPAADSLTSRLSTRSWPVANRRRTRLLRTGLSPTDFNNAVTTATFAAAYASGTPATPDSLGINSLAQNNVVAFRTAENRYGLMLISGIVLGTTPRLSCSVKVQK